MINLSHLRLHHSSSQKIYGDYEAIAKRVDLYTGDDFYFGFDSSNSSFLEMVGEYQPLAIKHGPTLTLYKVTGDGAECSVSYIDDSKKKIIPLFHIHAKSVASIQLFHQTQPWYFPDFSLLEFGSMEVQTQPSEKDLTPYDIISQLIEFLAQNQVPSDVQIQALHDAIQKVNAHDNGLSISIENLDWLKDKLTKQMTRPPSDKDFVTYNVFYNNPRLRIGFFQAFNLERITVRQILDDYPRIEVIIPLLPVSERYLVIFKNEDKILYEALQKAMPEPLVLCELLKQRFPESINQYLNKIGLPTTTPDMNQPTV